MIFVEMSTKLFNEGGKFTRPDFEFDYITMSPEDPEGYPSYIITVKDDTSLAWTPKAADKNSSSWVAVN